MSATSTIAFAQQCVFTGRVIDAKTTEPLQFASAYFNNTTIGSSTGGNGEFMFSNVPFGEYELIVSYVGYKTFRMKVRVSDSVQREIVRLVTQTTSLGEVEVKSRKDAGWENNLKQFAKQFFGPDQFVEPCRMLNPWVLDFKKSEDGTLTATASSPLEIENLAMGYLISYQMLAFNSGPAGYRIHGYTRFKEIKTTDTTLSALWRSRRAHVYFGSSRHLMKSIVNNSLEQDGFLIMEDRSGSNEIVRKSQYLANVNQSLFPINLFGKVLPLPGGNSFKVSLPQRIEIQYAYGTSKAGIYRNVFHPISWLEVNNGSLVVNKGGIVTNGGAMTVSGAMGEPRMAKILPNDYQPLVRDTADRVRPRKTSILADLIEKPYVHTDRPYYYQGDVVHFKVYMNYLNPFLKDSLSRVAYVDLLDSSGRTVTFLKLPVKNDMTHGNFVLPHDVPAGQYVLRTYTRLMQNFDNRLVFVTTIRILRADETVAGEIPSTPVSKGIDVTLSTTQVKPRSLIEFEIETKDDHGLHVASQLSVSVTDITQSVPLDTEKTIIEEFAIVPDYLPDESLNTIKYQIETGIELKGKVIIKKPRDLPCLITVYQPLSNDIFTTNTKTDGTFIYPLQFTGRIPFIVSAKSKRGRTRDVVIDSSRINFPTLALRAPEIEVIKFNKPAEYHVVPENVRVLEEVIVEGKKETKARADKKVLQADFVLDGQSLLLTNTTDLLSALQAKVPGLQITYQLDGGIISKFLTLSGPVGFEAAHECLVEVDGVMLMSSGTETIANQLASMSVSAIEKIEVVKYGNSAGFGARGANGVIIVTTRKGPLAPIERPDVNFRAATTTTLQGYSEPGQVKFPDYSLNTNEETTSDVRTTIFWHPAVGTDGIGPTRISFYAADIPTTYRIVIEGLDLKGNTLRAVNYLKVTGN
jgi:hypothetical protein